MNRRKRRQQKKMAEQQKTVYKQDEVKQESKALSTKLSQLSDRYMSTVTKQFEAAGIQLDDYSRQCGIHAIAAINALVERSGADWQKDIDTSNMQTILETVAGLKLNAFAQPREVYFILRNESKKVDGRDVWVKKIEYGIEGDGNDAILRNYGVDVKKVYPHWIVRSGDVFEYPKHRGMELTPPYWEETGVGEVVHVVYPIQNTDGVVEYRIGERSDVKANLLAHIRNNLMNETFGICESRYKANAEQKKKIDEKKDVLLKKAKELEFGALTDKDLEPYISPAWLDSTEAMIVRKIRNNIVKKYPKDFSNAYIQDVYETATDDTYRAVKAEIAEHAGKEVIDITPENCDRETGEVIEEAAPVEQKPPTTGQGQVKMGPGF
jgi:hypothetical protein